MHAPQAHHLTFSSRFGGGLMRCVAAMLVASAIPGWAQDRPPPGPSATPNGMTWGELSLLPEYCRDAMGILYGDQYYNPSPRASQWVALMGQGFWAMHHYCRALLYVRQAESAGTDANTRRFLYGRAKSDYVYTLNNSAPDMVLVPEILVRLGEAHLKLGEISDAFSAFERSRQMKPDYWPAYSRWIDVLIGLNKRKEARELAGIGLEYCPGCEVLRNQFKSLGGDPSKVVPRAVAPAASAAIGSQVKADVTTANAPALPSSAASAPMVQPTAKAASAPN